MRRAARANACFLGTVALNILLAFLIQEYPRWFAAATLSQFIIFFTLLKKEDSCITGLFNRLNKSDSDLYFIIYTVFVILASMAIKPYDVL